MADGFYSFLKSFFQQTFIKISLKDYMADQLKDVNKLFGQFILNIFQAFFSNVFFLSVWVFFLRGHFFVRTVNSDCLADKVGGRLETSTIRHRGWLRGSNRRQQGWSEHHRHRTSLCLLEYDQRTTRGAPARTRGLEGLQDQRTRGAPGACLTLQDSPVMKNTFHPGYTQRLGGRSEQRKHG